MAVQTARRHLRRVGIEPVPDRRRTDSASAVLLAALDHGPVARSTIARLVGLSPAAVSRQCADLAGRGLLREVPGGEAEPAGRDAGKPAGCPHVPVDLDTSQPVACGVHIALRHATLALLDLRGRVLARDRRGRRRLGGLRHRGHRRPRPARLAQCPGAWWTNLQAAYEGLSPAVQALADGLRAEHRYAGPDSGLSRDTSYAKRIEDNLLVAIHPVVRVHPITGAKELFVNPGFTSHIVDVSARESRAILGASRSWSPGGRSPTSTWSSSTTESLPSARL